MTCVELLFFAYRDFISDPDAILTEYGFGRAHHRVLHFVTRNPGLKIAELLDILKITKQSLARVLGELVRDGFIERRLGADDRRERLLHATPAGRALAARLAAPQLERIAAALASAGPEAQALAESFLYNMITDSERAHVAAVLAGSVPTCDAVPAAALAVRGGRRRRRKPGKAGELSP